jgi:hypothetical protein
MMHDSTLGVAERSEQIVQVQMDTLQTLVDRGNRVVRDSLSRIRSEPASWTGLIEAHTQLWAENLRTCAESGARIQGLFAEAIQTQLPAVSTGWLDAMALRKPAAPRPPADRGATATTEGSERPMKAAKAAQ